MPAIEGGVAVLTLGNAIFLAHEMLERPSSTQRLRRRLRALLKRISRLSQNPERVVPALRRMAAVLSLQAPNEAILFERESQQLADNLPFFQQKGSKMKSSYYQMNPTGLVINDGSDEAGFCRRRPYARAGWQP